MERAVVLTAVRTPIGKFLGALANVDAATLAAHVIEEAASRADVPAEEIDEVLVGNAVPAGTGQNVARQAALDAGIPREVPATTVSMMGGSSLRAVMMGQHMVQSEAAKCVVVAGVESSSQAPHLLSGYRSGWPIGNAELVDSLVRDAMWDPRCECLTGVIAENVARQLGISRKDQDDYALLSHRRCQDAVAKRRFLTEIAPVFIQSAGAAPQELSVDERPLQGEVTAEALERLRSASDAARFSIPLPVTMAPGEASVAIGNYAELGDGAAAIVLASESFAKAHGLEARYAILASAAAGVDPTLMPLGATEAARAVLQKAGMKAGDVDLLEIHENYAVVVLAAERELSLSLDKVNVLGGAIALGHPIGAEGTRMLTTLFHELPRLNASSGLVSVAVAGGQGVAVIIERL